MAAERSRAFPRRVALAVIVVVLVVLSFAFAAANRSQAIHLSFGIVSWRGPATHALFGAVVLGLAAMFFLGLPADLRARSDRQRLDRRLQSLERELEAERAGRTVPPAALPETASERTGNREEGGAV